MASEATSKLSLVKVIQRLAEESGLTFSQIGYECQNALDRGVRIVLYSGLEGGDFSKIVVFDSNEAEIEHWSILTDVFLKMHLDYELPNCLELRGQTINAYDLYADIEDLRSFFKAAKLPLAGILTERRKSIELRQVRDKTYLNAIGALCELLWREIRPNEAKDINQAAIIDLITNELPKTPGLSERNLKEILPLAIKSIRSEL